MDLLTVYGGAKELVIDAEPWLILGLSWVWVRSKLAALKPWGP